MARTTTTAPAAAPARRGRLAVVLVAAVALGAGVLLGWLLTGASGGASGGGSDGVAAPEPGSVEAVAAELAEGQEQESAALADELATAAEQAHGRAATVLVGLAALAPPEGSGAGDAGGDAVTGTDTPAGDLPAELDRARETLTATGQGSDDHAVTRAALIGSLDLLEHAAQTAADLPADDAGRQVALTQLARDRDAAVELWQAGATRLDSLVVAGGGEHVHLFLAPDGDPASLPQEFQERHED